MLCNTLANPCFLGRISHCVWINVPFGVTMYIFPDECKHRSECARSKERCLCTVTSFLVRCPLHPLDPPPPCGGETQILKYFPEVLETLPEYKHDVTVFVRLCKLKYKRKFMPSFCAMRITSIVRFSCTLVVDQLTKFNYVMPICAR